MIANAAQRSDGGRVSYRPLGERIDPAAYDVGLIPDDTTARAFVEREHYSGTYPAARYRVGLYRRGGALEGVAVFSHPMQDRVLDALPCDRHAAVELGRFVLLHSVPSNGESWFLARAFELIHREGVCGVVSFADPVARTDLRGRVVTPGHVGVIYQASNAVLAGRSTARTLHVLADGTVLSERAISKIRGHERGWQAAAAVLVKLGAAPLASNDNATAWLREWLPRLTRRVRHPGCYRYLFGLERATRKRLPASDPYPRIEVSEADRRWLTLAA